MPPDWIAPGTPLPPHPLLSRKRGQHIHHFAYLPVHSTVFIPTHRRPGALNAALASLIPQCQWIREVLICPNPQEAAPDSTDETTRKLLQTLQLLGANTRVVPQPSYAEAIQFAARNALCESVLIMDDDAVLGKDYLDLSAHLRYARVGAVSGSLQTPFQEGYTDWSGDPILAGKDLLRINRMVVLEGKLHFKDKLQVYRIADGRFYFFADFLIGTALFMRRGLMKLSDPQTFRRDSNHRLVMSGHEIDHTLSIREAGFHLLYDAKRVAWHLHAQTGRLRDFDLDMAKQNWNYILQKHGYPEIDQYPGVRADGY